MSDSPNKNSRIINHFKASFFEVFINEDRLLTVEALNEMEYGAKEVEEIVNNINILSGNLKYLVLIVAGEHSSITYDALKTLAKPEAMKYAFAKAYVIHSVPQRLMSHFYMHFFKPKIPIKFFKKRAEAEAWLMTNYGDLIKSQ
jgi:hypothetical protein